MDTSGAGTVKSHYSVLFRVLLVVIVIDNLRKEKTQSCSLRGLKTPGVCVCGGGGVVTSLIPYGVVLVCLSYHWIKINWIL